MSERKIVRVRDVMKTDFDMVDGLMTVAEALQAMEHLEARALIIKKRHEDDEYGIVLLSDIAKRVLAQDRSPERVNVYEIMSKPVVSVHSMMDIRYCARLFERFGLAMTPVIDDRNILGLISYNDMILKGLVPLLNER